MVLCPDCSYDNKVGALVCTGCGADLYDSFLEKVSTRQLDGDEKGERKVAEKSATGTYPIVLYVGGEHDPLALDRDGEIVLGRIDDDNHDDSTLDLTPYGGQKHGVSRHHARLLADESPPVLLDLNSSNGTYVNGQRLIPSQPYYLRSGDEIRLGHLTVRIYYK